MAALGGQQEEEQRRRRSLVQAHGEVRRRRDGVMRDSGEKMSRSRDLWDFNSDEWSGLRGPGRQRAGGRSRGQSGGVVDAKTDIFGGEAPNPQVAEAGEAGDELLHMDGGVGCEGI
ncbi:hypothetical protein TRIUR3_34219 [Triticum urartu]|uniref:Uncharacterized protein n=1 Tax=Triticum urartu TaxID=4572 RepID=M7ZU32_TRIUA|nr:hypothetical protein TRIUR3_34219 [Triticum urartu]